MNNNILIDFIEKEIKKANKSVKPFFIGRESALKDVLNFIGEMKQNEAIGIVSAYCQCKQNYPVQAGFKGEQVNNTRGNQFAVCTRCNKQKLIPVTGKE